MTKMTTEEFADLVEKIGEMMPEEVEPEHLVSFILTIMHCYFDQDKVPWLLRQVADACERDAEHIKAMLDVANEP